MGIAYAVPFPLFGGLMNGENFKLWVEGNRINDTQIWKLDEGFYETKRKNDHSDGYLSPVFFVWDKLGDRQMIATLNYQEAFAVWRKTINGKERDIFSLHERRTSVKHIY